MLRQSNDAAHNCELETAGAALFKGLLNPKVLRLFGGKIQGNALIKERLPGFFFVQTPVTWR